MNYLNQNIKYLRKEKNLTQQALALKVGINRSVIGAYEEGRSVPKLSILQLMANYFGCSIDSMVNLDLSSKPTTHTDNKKEKLRILTILTDNNNNELITLVPEKAAAGYPSGYSDPGYIESLPRFALPLSELSNNRSYRSFQISGESMLPIPDGSYIIGEYIEKLEDIRDGKSYILVTENEGIVYKRIYSSSNNRELLLKSDNESYEPYSISTKNVREIWKALGYISFSLPEQDTLSFHTISNLVIKMREEIDELKK